MAFLLGEAVAGALEVALVPHHRALAHDNAFGDASMVELAGAMGALDKLEVRWCPTALSPCLETLHVHTPDSKHLFDVLSAVSCP